MQDASVAARRIERNGDDGVALQYALQAAFPSQMDTSPNFLKIQPVQSPGQQFAAGALVERRYADRGYRNLSARAVQRDHEITLIADENDVTVGTVTIGFDSPRGLFIDDLFADEVNALRAAGDKLCEFTKLAMDQIERSASVLASLFETAYLYAHRVMGFDKLLIEVNPRHVRYYERMYGFSVIGEERHNLRVDAPAVLLCLDFAKLNEQISGQAAFTPEQKQMRSLNRYHRALIEIMSEEGLSSREVVEIGG
ncbi:MAG: long-chain N-acyl amino acid synthase [Pseudomonadota bacterium]